MITPDIETIEKLMEEIGKLQQGCALLEDIWFECGAYGEHRIPFELMSRMQTFFDFDDSE